MVQKCKNCGEKIVKYPLKDKEGNLIWINLFKMDSQTFFMVLALILVMLGTKQLTQECNEIIEHPIDFCTDYGYCNIKLQIEEQQKQYAILTKGIDINISTLD